MIDVAAAFDVKPSVHVKPGYTLVAIETAANIAVGTAPWGPATTLRVREGEALPAVDGQLVLVGRDNHRREWVRTLIDGARAADDSVIAVDMGWPGTDRDYADVSTFGASRHVSQALSAWLGEAVR